MSDLKKVTISVELDGDQYCALLGIDMMAGVCGFGSTIDEAIESFCESWISASPMERKKAIESTPSIESGDVKLTEEIYQEVTDWIRGLWSELLASLPDDVETVNYLCVDIRLDRSFISTSSIEASQANKTFIEGRFPKDVRMSYFQTHTEDWRMMIKHMTKDFGVSGKMRQVVIGKFCKEWKNQILYQESHNG